MAIPSPGGETAAHIHQRARALGLTNDQYEVIDRSAGAFDNLGDERRYGNERVMEALDPTNKTILTDRHGPISAWYRAVISEPPMGHTESDRAALAGSPVTVLEGGARGCS